MSNRNKIKGILFGSCLALLIVIVLGSIYLIARAVWLVSESSQNTDHALEQVVVRQSDTNHKIALIDIHGLILRDGVMSDGVSSQEFIQQELEAAEDDADIDAIILDIDSPGGAVVPSSLLHDAIAAATKPVVAFYSGDVAGSGAVYASVAAKRIISQPDTLTGSIGVIAEFLDLSELLNKYGVKMNTIKSGPFKDIGSNTREMTPAERSMLQGLIDESYARFVTAVADGRHLEPATVKTFADGRIFSGTTAKSLGLVDELGNLDTAIKAAKSLANVTDAQIIQYSEPFSFSSIFSLFSSQLQKNNPLGLITHYEEKPGLRLLYVMK